MTGAAVDAGTPSHLARHSAPLLPVTRPVDDSKRVVVRQEGGKARQDERDRLTEHGSRSGAADGRCAARGRERGELQAGSEVIELTRPQSAILTFTPSAPQGHSKMNQASIGCPEAA